MSFIEISPLITFGKLQKDKSISILRSSFIVSSLTLLSRVFGFLRDILIANKLGTSVASDALFVAMIIPNLLRRLFAEGAFNVVFVPLLSQIQEEKGQKEAEKFAASAYTMLAIVLLIVTILAEAFMEPFITHVLARGWEDAERIELATLLSRITFPYLMLITFASLAGGISNTYGKFGPFAITPVILNISFISGILALPYLGLSTAESAAYAMTIGGVFQMAYMWKALKNIPFTLKLTTQIKHAETPNLLKRLGPAALSVGILQVSMMIDLILASHLEENAISYLQFANRFYQQPLSLIGIALATVLLPHLSRALKADDKTEANQSFTNALCHGGSLAVFSTIGLVTLAYPLIHTLFGHGAFTAESSQFVATALQAYCIALPAFVISKITITCFYAHGNTKTPLKVSAFSLILNIILNIILMQKYGYVGIALATAIAGWINAIAQLIILKRHGFIHIHNKSDVRMFTMKAISINIAVLMMIVCLKELVTYEDLHATLHQILWLAVVGSLSLCTFIFGAHFLKLFNVHEIKAAILKRRK